MEPGHHRCRRKWVFGRRPRQLPSVPELPNPFSAGTLIHYQLPKGSWVTIKVFDLLGREVRTLVDEESPGSFYRHLGRQGRERQGHGQRCVPLSGQGRGLCRDQKDGVSALKKWLLLCRGAAEREGGVELPLHPCHTSSGRRRSPGGRPGAGACCSLRGQLRKQKASSSGFHVGAMTFARQGMN